MRYAIILIVVRLLYEILFMNLQLHQGSVLKYVKNGHYPIFLFRLTLFLCWLEQKALVEKGIFGLGFRAVCMNFDGLIFRSE